MSVTGTGPRGLFLRRHVVYAALGAVARRARSPAPSASASAPIRISPARACPGAGLHDPHGKQTDLIFEPAKKLKQPWIAFQGDKDQVCSAPAAAAFAAQVANGQIVKLPLVGHGFSVEKNWMLQFKEAYARLLPPSAGASERAPDIGDLPLEEVARERSVRGVALLTGTAAGPGSTRNWRRGWPRAACRPWA